MRNGAGCSHVSLSLRQGAARNGRKHASHAPRLRAPLRTDQESLPEVARRLIGRGPFRFTAIYPGACRRCNNTCFFKYRAWRCVQGRLVPFETIHYHFLATVHPTWSPHADSVDLFWAALLQASAQHGADHSLFARSTRGDRAHTPNCSPPESGTCPDLEARHLLSGPGHYAVSLQRRGGPKSPPEVLGRS